MVPRDATKLKNLSMIFSKLEKSTLCLSRQYVSKALIFKAAEVRQFKFLVLISMILSQMRKKSKLLSTVFDFITGTKEKRLVFGEICSEKLIINLKKLFA